MTLPQEYLPGTRLPKGHVQSEPVNQDGYRGREFEDLGNWNILFIGDEYTEGVGIAEAETYPALVAEKLTEFCGRQVNAFNLGHHGKGYDYVSRILWCALNVMTPDFVFVCFPPMDRREYFAIDGRLIDYDRSRAEEIHSGALTVDRVEREITGNLRSLLTEYDAPINALRNVVLIEALLRGKNIPWSYGANARGNKHLELLMSREWLEPNRYIGSRFGTCEFGLPDTGAHAEFGNQIFTWIRDNPESGL